MNEYATYIDQRCKKKINNTQVFNIHKLETNPLGNFDFLLT